MEVYIGMGWGMMEENGWRKGFWIVEEDRLFIECVKVYGEGRWNFVVRFIGIVMFLFYFIIFIYNMVFFFY